MKEYLKNNCHISGDTLEGLHAFCEDIAAHTKKSIIDFRGCMIMHYHDLDARTGVMRFFKMNTASRSEILKFDPVKGTYTVPLTGKIEASKFKDCMPLLDEMRKNEAARTMFLFDGEKQKKYLFVADSAKKTFGQKMPVNDFNSSLARDIYLAHKLNENLDIPVYRTNSDGSRSKAIGSCVVRERVMQISPTETVSKAVAFFSKEECSKVEDFAAFSKMIKDLASAHDGVSLCGKWSYNSQYMKVTLAFRDEESLTSKKGIVAAHTFYMSDTGHLKAKVVPSWVIDGSVCEVKDDEVPLSAKDGVIDWETALSKSYEKHLSETNYLAEKSAEEVLVENNEKLLEDIIKRTGMESSQTGLVQKQIIQFKNDMIEVLKGNPVTTYSDLGVLASKTLLKGDALTETSEKRIHETFAGRLLFLKN